MAGLFWKVRALKEQGRQREAFSNALRGSTERPYVDEAGQAMGDMLSEAERQEMGYESQPEGLMGERGAPNIQNALNQMYAGPGDQPVQAFNIQRQLSKERDRGLTASKLPSTLQIFDRWNSLDKQGKRDLENIIREQTVVKTIGGQPSLVDKRTGGIATLSTLDQESDAKSQLAASQKEGMALGTARTELADIEASLPRLNTIVNELSELGKKATYTLAGQATDIAMRQAGLTPRDAAIARKEYISKVDNEILPLLRQTFGAAFTVKEGESLRATLGDVNASPEEKDAVLKSFISQKISQVEVKRRRAGEPVYKIGDITNAPNGQRVIIKSLKEDGTPDDVDPL